MREGWGRGGGGGRGERCFNLRVNNGNSGFVALCINNTLPWLWVHNTFWGGGGVNFYIKNKNRPTRLLTSLPARQILMLGKEWASSERKPCLAVLQTLEDINPMFGQRGNEVCAALTRRQPDRCPSVVSIVFLVIVINPISSRGITLRGEAVWI